MTFPCGEIPERGTFSVVQHTQIQTRFSLASFNLPRIICRIYNRSNENTHFPWVLEENLVRFCWNGDEGSGWRFHYDRNSEGTLEKLWNSVSKKNNIKFAYCRVTFIRELLLGFFASVINLGVHFRIPQRLPFGIPLLKILPSVIRHAVRSGIPAFENCFFWGSSRTSFRNSCTFFWELLEKYHKKLLKESWKDYQRIPRRISEKTAWGISEITLKDIESEIKSWKNLKRSCLREELL